MACSLEAYCFPALQDVSCENISSTVPSITSQHPITAFQCRQPQFHLQAGLLRTVNAPDFSSSLNLVSSPLHGRHVTSVACGCAQYKAVHTHEASWVRRASAAQERCARQARMTHGGATGWEKGRRRAVFLESVNRPDRVYAGLIHYGTWPHVHYASDSAILTKRVSYKMHLEEQVRTRRKIAICRSP